MNGPTLAAFAREHSVALTRFAYLICGGVVLGSAYYGSGQYVDGYWEDGRTALPRVDLSTLPELHC